MDNSIYIALSRQTGVMRDMAVTANNIANVDTTGYSAQEVMFEDYIVDDGNRNKMAFSNDARQYTDTEAGSFKVTDNEFDLAIKGPGYFTVQTPLGTRYTKAGDFTVNDQGILVTSADGYPVLDDAGQEIAFDEGDSSIVIGEDGMISVNGEQRATVGMTEFANPQLLDHVAGAYYTTKAQGQPATQSRMLQGVLESSNVKPVLELTHMLDVSRLASNTAKFIESMYDLQRKASNTITKQS